MAALVPITCARAGGGDTAAGLVAAGAGGDTFPAGPNSFLKVKNGNAAVCIVTATPPTGGAAVGGTEAPIVLTPSVAATTGEQIYGPFPLNPFGDATGQVHVSYSVTATVTVAALLMSAS